MPLASNASFSLLSHCTNNQRNVLNRQPGCRRLNPASVSRRIGFVASAGRQGHDAAAANIGQAASAVPGA